MVLQYQGLISFFFQYFPNIVFLIEILTKKDSLGITECMGNKVQWNQVELTYIEHIEETVLNVLHSGTQCITCAFLKDGQLMPT